ncbi:MAG: DUF6683 family protein [Methyloglobulus sp.]|nr:hypothetical protein [Methyloglobulus sp.]
MMNIIFDVKVLVSVMKFIQGASDKLWVSKNLIRPLLSLSLALCAANASRADDFLPFQPYAAIPDVLAPMVMSNLANENLRLVNKHYASKGKSSSSKTPAAKVSATATLAPAAVAASSAPRLLAAPYPVEQRPKFEQAFAQSLLTYQQLESKLGIPKNDVAGAVSAFLAGNYMAYRDISLPDPHFMQLVKQMRAVLVANSEFIRSSPAQKLEMYEQMAIIGTLMAVSQVEIKRGNHDPNVTRNFQQSAKTNLEQFLKTSADRIHIDEGGLTLR